MPTKKSRKSQSEVLTKTRTKQKLKQPKMYRVLFHNDDYTPMEFVVLMLMWIFNHSEPEATRIMLHVHNRGIGVAGVYPFSVAETRVTEVTTAAEKSEYPLLCTMEPATGGKDQDGGSEE